MKSNDGASSGATAEASEGGKAKAEIALGDFITGAMRELHYYEERRLRYY